jgi:uncharacterized protein YbjQ (UPF0145 family)
VAKKVWEDDPAFQCAQWGKPFIATTSTAEGTTAFEYVQLGNQKYCPACAQGLAARVVVTTTPTVEGYCVDDYLGLESVEYVIGTGLFTEMSGELEDFFGRRSSALEMNLSQAKKASEMLLKLAALKRGGNAVIGVDMDYTEFSSNRVALILNRTVVRIQRVIPEVPASSA